MSRSVAAPSRTEYVEPPLEHAMHARLALPALALAALAACTIPEQDYPEAYADATCDKQRRCDDDFSEHWDSKRECFERTADLIDDLMGVSGLFGCTYDQQAGTRCVQAIRAATCTEYEDGYFGDACDSYCE